MRRWPILAVFAFTLAGCMGAQDAPAAQGTQPDTVPHFWGTAPAYLPPDPLLTVIAEHSASLRCDHVTGPGTVGAIPSCVNDDGSCWEGPGNSDADWPCDRWPWAMPDVEIRGEPWYLTPEPGVPDPTVIVGLNVTVGEFHGEPVPPLPHHPSFPWGEVRPTIMLCFEGDQMEEFQCMPLIEGQTYTPGRAFAVGLGGPFAWTEPGVKHLRAYPAYVLSVDEWTLTVTVETGPGSILRDALADS